MTSTFALRVLVLQSILLTGLVVGQDEQFECIRQRDDCAYGSGSGAPNVYYAGIFQASGQTVPIELPPIDSLPSPGDLILIIQMQDASWNYSNSSNYGAGTGSSSGYLSLFSTGRYEFQTVDEVLVVESRAILRTEKPLRFTYNDALGTLSSRSRKFQVLKVNRCAALTLTSDIECLHWNGRTGGVIAIVTSSIDFQGYTISCSGGGFRGGIVDNIYVAQIPTYDYASTNRELGGTKGEGICGTPYQIVPGRDINFVNGFDRYQGGDYCRGAPGNAGGGGNQHNACGGGGGSAGRGGEGGGAVSGNPKDNGGKGGSSVPFTTTRWFMGK